MRQRLDLEGRRKLGAVISHSPAHIAKAVCIICPLPWHVTSVKGEQWEV